MQVSPFRVLSVGKDKATLTIRSRVLELAGAEVLMVTSEAHAKMAIANLELSAIVIGYSFNPLEQARISADVRRCQGGIPILPMAEGILRPELLVSFVQQARREHLLREELPAQAKPRSLQFPA